MGDGRRDDNEKQIRNWNQLLRDTHFFVVVFFVLFYIRDRHIDTKNTYLVHTSFPYAGDMPCFVLFSCLFPASFRSPALLAKITSTLDQVSNGRFILGIGAGWFDKEYHAHGYPFPSTRERLAQLEETVRIVKAMWCEETPRFKGEYFAIDGAFNHPRPIQTPHPPIMLGGSGSGLIKIAAAHGDILNMIPPTSNGKDFVNDPEATVKFTKSVLIKKIGQLKQYAEQADRNPDDIELSGFTLVALSNKSSDPILEGIAKQLGFANLAAAQKSPVALMGTPEQAIEELKSRIDATGMSYHIVLPMNPDSYQALVSQVMPAITA